MKRLIKGMVGKHTGLTNEHVKVLNEFLVDRKFKIPLDIRRHKDIEHNNPYLTEKGVGMITGKYTVEIKEYPFKENLEIGMTKDKARLFTDAINIMGHHNLLIHHNTELGYGHGISKVHEATGWSSKIHPKWAKSITHYMKELKK